MENLYEKYRQKPGIEKLIKLFYSKINED